MLNLPLFIVIDTIGLTTPSVFTVKSSLSIFGLAEIAFVKQTSIIFLSANVNVAEWIIPLLVLAYGSLTTTVLLVIAQLKPKSFPVLELSKL